MRDLARLVRRHGRSSRRIGQYRPISVGDSFETLVMISGTARSGTTWLQELLGAQARFRIMFEPFHIHRAPERLRSVPAYVPPALVSAPFVADVEDVLRGRVHDKWIDHCNHHAVSRRRLIKEIHSNLRLGWFRERFPYFPIVYLIRHPLAVAASHARLGWGSWLDDLFSNAQLVEDHLEPFRQLYESCRNEFDRQIMQWCIENFVPLTFFRGRADIVVVLYERLVTNLDSELGRVVEALGLELRRGASTRSATPSTTAHRAGNFDFAGALGEWQGEFDSRDISRALETLTAFGLDALYGTGTMPRDVDPLNIFSRGGSPT